MNRAFKYRIYPTSEQETLIRKTFGCCRKVWNLMLADKIAYYQQTEQMLQTTPAMYKKDYPFLREVDSLALANVQLHLQTAYRNFFRNPKTRFPKFKSAKHSRKSYTTNRQGNSIELGDTSIKLPKLGRVKAKIHRLPEDHWNLKSVTVSQEPDGRFYASVLFEFEELIPIVVVSDHALGLDYKSDGLYMDSEHHIGQSHKYFRESQKKLSREQRRLARKQGARKNETKSNNYKKQLKKVARIYRHAANQRKDHLHKISTAITKQYDVVCVEDLDMKALSNKGFRNGKATMDNGYGLFLQMLEYKLRAQGKHFVKVDKWYPSSQICSCCGSRTKLSLKDRIYHCTCGLNIDRDYNAAINIKREGLRILGFQAA